MTRRLLVLNVDSTLITSTVVELVAEHTGTQKEIADILLAAAKGTIDAAESIERQMATLKGLPVSVFDRVLDDVRLTPGAKSLVETLHGREWTIGLVSEGFVEVVAPLAARLGITLYSANKVNVVDDLLTGEAVCPVVDGASKAQALVEWAKNLSIPQKDTAAIGSRVNDLAMMTAAGLGIAFNAEPPVQERADETVTSSRLDTVLGVLP